MKRTITRRRMLQVGGMAALSAGTAAVAAGAPALADAGDPVLRVRAKRPRSPVSRLLTGVNNDKWYGDSDGLWDPETGAPVPDGVAKTARAGIGLIRFPGGTSANLFRWKRAIGPEAQRGCQVDGAADGGPRDSVYGPDEHMTFVSAAAAQAEIMASFITNTPADAADWVAYMNAPVGTEWGDRRAANGHPEPYGVRYWEIGNELDRVSERYWLSPDSATAMRQYAVGGTQRQVGQRVGTDCDHRPAASISDGSANQRFLVWYPPVVPRSQVVYVAGAAWAEVASLGAAGAADRVYELDPATGTITFGDGIHGAIPPVKAAITVDYDSGPHPGFVDFYAAMKAADPTIDVLATWAPISAATGLGGVSFPQLMAELGHADRYDGVVIHPYTNFGAQFQISGFPTERVGHDDTMIGEAHATSLVEGLMAEVGKYAPARTYVAISEFGALFFGSHDATVYPTYDTAMSHVLYMASQWARYADLGLPWVMGNTLISDTPSGLRGVLGGAPQFVYTADATAREQLRPLVTGGGSVVETSVENNPTVQAAHTPLGATYQALVATAAVGADGSLRLMVVNRAATDPVTSQVALEDYSHQPGIEGTVVAGSTFTSFNSADHPDDVAMRPVRATVTPAAFRWTFPAHSVTLLHLAPA